MPDNEKSPHVRTAPPMPTVNVRETMMMFLVRQINTVVYQITYSGTSDGSEQQKHNSPQYRTRNGFQQRTDFTDNGE